MDNLKKFNITGSTLKLLAVLSMLVDHVGLFVFRNNDAFLQVLCTIGSWEVTPYSLMRAFGCLAFPVLLSWLWKVLYIHGTDGSKDAISCCLLLS